MGDWMKRLGKFIQELIDKIRQPKKKEEKEITHDEESPLYWCVPGETYLNTGSVFMKSDDNDLWEYLGSIYGDGNTLVGAVEIPSGPELSLKFSNIPESLLPKRYWCKTLILTLAASQPYEYQAVDMSQYEERGLAHFIVGSPHSAEEMIAEYIEGIRNGLSEEELQEEEQWLQEIIETTKENGMHSFPVAGATLLHYESLGLWDIEEEDE